VPSQIASVSDASRQLQLDPTEHRTEACLLLSATSVLAVCQGCVAPIVLMSVLVLFRGCPQYHTAKVQHPGQAWAAGLAWPNAGVARFTSVRSLHGGTGPWIHHGSRWLPRPRALCGSRVRGGTLGSQIPPQPEQTVSLDERGRAWLRASEAAQGGPAAKTMKLGLLPLFVLQASPRIVAGVAEALTAKSGCPRSRCARCPSRRGARLGSCPGQVLSGHLYDGPRRAHGQSHSHRRVTTVAHSCSQSARACDVGIILGINSDQSLAAVGQRLG
jgi:hypothetical protein